MNHLKGSKYSTSIQDCQSLLENFKSKKSNLYAIIFKPNENSGFVLCEDMMFGEHFASPGLCEFYGEKGVVKLPLEEAEEAAFLLGRNVKEGSVDIYNLQLI